MGRREEKEDEQGSNAFFGEGEGEYCSTCGQEYVNHCPIASADCPFEESEDGEDEDEEDADFDDVRNVKEVLDDDDEADRLTEEESEIPPEDIEGKD